MMGGRMNWEGLRIGLIGPLPPPAGGMANQTRQLADLLRREGAAVTLVQTNAPYVPRCVGRLRGLRALFRLPPYLVRLWRAAGEVDVFHVMANSGLSWHLMAIPAIRVARLRGVGVIVNYRGGGAADFFERASKRTLRGLQSVDALITPSEFLRDVFARIGMQARVVPNIIDCERFRRAAACVESAVPNLLVARNLERIYDIATAIRAFAIVRGCWPAATLTVAGSGPELGNLQRLATELGVSGATCFTGRVENARMPELYARATVALNPSTVDNMPISILEAYASGVPVVSTRVGGVPYIAEHEQTALLVDVGDADGMAQAVLRLLGDPALARRLAEAGTARAQRYAWPELRESWHSEYRRAARRPQAAEVPS
jgi:glycosyltransferase involved in cell wall biosynthesis